MKWYKEFGLWLLSTPMLLVSLVVVLIIVIFNLPLLLKRCVDDGI